jgi:hypothetical protein
MNILGFISSIFKPAVDLIDDLHTSEEERMQLTKELMKIENALTKRIIEYESQLLTSQSEMVKAESTGHSWLQRNWRPITMLTFLVLVILNSFGLLITPLADEAWLLLQIGLGGYVVGRSAEKIIPSLTKKKTGEAVG